MTRDVNSSGGVWRPALWLRTLAATTPARWPHIRAVRAAVAIGGPLLVAVLAGHPAVGMWISMGALMISAGERVIPYRTRYRQLAVIVPIVALTYLLGNLSSAPPGVTTLVMAALAFVAGIASGYSAVLSVATMQAMLIAGVAIGVPGAAPYWPAALLFVAGAALYGLLLGLEAVVDQRRPQREALVAVLDALAALAAHRAQGTDSTEKLRASAVDAINNFDRLTLGQRASAHGPTAAAVADGRISRAADQLLARLLAHDARAPRSDLAAIRLTELAEAVRHQRPVRPAGDDPTLVRVHLLEDAIWAQPAGTAHSRAYAGSPTRPPAAPAATAAATSSSSLSSLSSRWRFSPPGRALVITAARLSLVTAAAYAVVEFTPIPRAYWVAMTVALVMKPDLGSVFARAVLRSVGSVAGAGIAVILSLVLHDDLGLAVAATVLALFLPWAVARSYALQALIMTPLIMIMISLISSTVSMVDLSYARILSTVIGALIVILLGYVIWPQARHPKIAPAFSTALGDLSDYADAVTEDRDDAAVSAARRTAYRSLSDARVAARRILAEPPPAGVEAAAWLAVVDAATRVSDRITDVSGSLDHKGDLPDGAMLRALAGYLDGLETHPPTADPAVRSPEALLATAPEEAPDGRGAADPAVVELADEIGLLGSMLVRTGSAG